MHFQTVLSVAAMSVAAIAAPSGPVSTAPFPNAPVPSRDYDGYKVWVSVKPDSSGMLGGLGNKYIGIVDSGISTKYPHLSKIPSLAFNSVQTGFAYHSNGQFLWKDHASGKMLSAWSSRDGTLFFAQEDKMPTGVKADKGYEIDLSMNLSHGEDKFWACQYMGSDHAPQDSLSDVDTRDVRSGWGYLVVAKDMPSNWGTMCAEATLTLRKDPLI